ncbi:MAG: CoA transferase, partial [Chloroflexi bacterium]|nr:CoA transferase [Chloroflexota bacterium]
FGQTGPWRDWKSTEITDWALSGYMYLMGDPKREPLMTPCDQGEFYVGAQAALGSLIALWHAHRTGEGQYVDVSVTESMLSAHIWTSSTWVQEGIIMRRAGTDAYPTRDGYIVLMDPTRLDLNFFILIDRPDLVDDPRFADQTVWSANIQVLRDLLAEWLLTQSKEDVFKKAQELRMPNCPVYDASDLLKWEHLRERKFFLNLDHPVAGKITMPGFPYVFSEASPSLRKGPPLLTEDTKSWPESVILSEAKNPSGPSVEASGARPSPPPLARLRERVQGEGPSRLPPVRPEPAARAGLPLRGLRILELTQNWAGPQAGRFLADMGAEIIKFEGPDRVMGRSGHFTGQQIAKYYYNRVDYFHKFNRNKYGVTLNLLNDKGRAIFLDIAKHADVVLENYSPRVLQNMGLTWPVLQKANPAISLLSVSGFGQTGPARNYIAYGANIEASGGLAAITGYPDDPKPYRTSLYYADPITAIHVAIAVFACLRHREHTGRGQYVDLSLEENSIAFLAESILHYTMSSPLPSTGEDPWRSQGGEGRIMPRRGARSPRFAPQGCYRAAGDDQWFVLSVRDDDDWRRLRSVIADPALDNARYATLAGRRQHHDAIDAVIAKWAAQHDHHEAPRLLQAAGLPAAPVLANWEMQSNWHFAARGFYIPVAQNETGVWTYPSWPWKLSKTPGAAYMGAPEFGEHNRLILHDWLGLSDAQLAALYADRTVSDAPPPTPIIVTPPPPAR